MAGALPADKIEEIRRQTGPAKFDSQMMLQPRNVEEIRLDPARLIRYDAQLELREANGEAILSLAGRRLVSASCWWDPAYGAPDTGDASVVAGVFVDEAGVYWLHGIRYLRHDPEQRHETDEATQLCRQVAAFVEEFHLPSVAIETNGIGRFLPALLRRELQARGLACPVLEHVSRTQQGTADSASVRSLAGCRRSACACRRLGVTVHRGDARVAPRAPLSGRRSGCSQRLRAGRTGSTFESRTGEEANMAPGTSAPYGRDRLRSLTSSVS